MAKSKETGVLRITWIKSAIGRTKQQKETIRALGFRKLNQTIERPDIPEVRGMINSVSHLVEFEEIGD